MARPLRISYEGAVYHVTIRGNERRALFHTKADRERLITKLGESQERAKEMYQEMLQAHDRKEDISFRREGGDIATDEVLRTTLAILGVSQRALLRRSRNSIIRAVVAYALCRYAGCTQRAAATVMGGCSGVAVSQQLARLHDQLKSDKKLRKVLSQLEQQLTV